MADLVTVENVLVLVGIRFGISLVLAILALRLPLTILVLTVFALAVLAFSTLALEHGDVHWHNVILIAGPGNGRHLSSYLVEGVESTRMESQMVPDRRVLDASLEHSCRTLSVTDSPLCSSYFLTKCLNCSIRSMS